MKSKIFILLLILSTSIKAQLWRADERFEKNTIVVDGYAVIEEPADFASFNFKVKGYGKSLSEAVKNAKEKINNISEKLFKVGLKEKNLFTSHFNSGENFDNKAFLSSSKDFVASIDVVVQLDSLVLLEPAIICVSENNPDMLSNISYEIKDIEKLREKVLDLATLKAREKAKVISSRLELKINYAIYVEETSSTKTRGDRFSNIVVVANDRSTQSGPRSFFAETIKIESSVKVIFRVESLNR
ncbi:MAG: SIMPL domain-containing protein [Calditrichaceae bacterium]